MREVGKEMQGKMNQGKGRQWFDVRKTGLVLAGFGDGRRTHQPENGGSI